VLASKIIVAGTGGTIAGRAAASADNIGYQAGSLSVGDVLQTLPRQAMDRLAEQGVKTSWEDVAQVDSKDMGPQVWAPLLARLRQWLADPEVKAVVLTHGTDTIEETAWLLSALLVSHKPVVMTCAMRPATAWVPDGPQNLLDALAVACDPLSRGVCVVASGVVHAAQWVQKVHPYQLDAFSSGDEGALARVEEGRVRWFGKNEEKSHFPPVLNKELAIEFIVGNRIPWPRVEVVFSHAGATEHGVAALCEPREGREPLRGLVVAGTGNGTVHHAMDQALRRAHGQGVLVWRCSRCVNGQVVSAGDSPATGAEDLAPALWPAVALPPFKARLAMALTLMGQLA
jgi:L-asparaginase